MENSRQKSLYFINDRLHQSNQRQESKQNLSKINKLILYERKPSRENDNTELCLPRNQLWLNSKQKIHSFQLQAVPVLAPIDVARTTILDQLQITNKFLEKRRHSLANDVDAWKRRISLIDLNRKKSSNLSYRFFCLCFVALVFLIASILAWFFTKKAILEGFASQLEIEPNSAIYSKW